MFYNNATFKVKTYGAGSHTDILAEDRTRRALHFYNHLASAASCTFELDHDTFNDAVTLQAGEHYEFLGTIPINAITITVGTGAQMTVMAAGDADFA